MAPPTKQELISLVESMCNVQDRIIGARGMPDISKCLTWIIYCGIKGAGVYPWLLLTHTGTTKAHPHVMRLHCIGGLVTVMLACS